MYTLSYLFMIFFLTSLMGYICEVIYCSIVDHYFEWNRGFLFGPYVPIYGVGTLLIIGLSKKYFNDPIALFWLTVITCSLVEYFASWIMEKLFKVRWWNYSTQKFNVNGRICLLNSFLFGFGGLLIIYVLYPFFQKILVLIPQNITIGIALVCATIFVIDFIVTVVTLISIKITIEDIENSNYKSTDETELVRAKAIERIKENVTFYNPILKAFPSIDGVKKDSFKQFRVLVEGVKKTIAAGGKVVDNTRGKVVEKTQSLRKMVKK